MKPGRENGPWRCFPLTGITGLKFRSVPSPSTDEREECFPSSCDMSYRSTSLESASVAPMLNRFWPKARTFFKNFREKSPILRRPVPSNSIPGWYLLTPRRLVRAKKVKEKKALQTSMHTILPMTKNLR